MAALNQWRTREIDAGLYDTKTSQDVDTEEVQIARVVQD